MPYLGYLLAQALKAGDTIAQAITSASNFVTKVGGSVVDLSPSVEALKSPSDGSAYINDGVDTTIPAINGSDMTVSCWFYVPNSTSSSIRAIWSTSESGAYGYQYLYIPGNSTTLTSMWGIGTASGSYVSFPAGTVQAGKWTHVTCVHTASTNYIYTNGVLVGQANAGNTTRASSTYKIGTYGIINNLTLNGNVANWGMWQRVLSAEEIRSVMNKSYADLTASETKGLLSWHALDELSGNVSPDSHGNYNGTY